MEAIRMHPGFQARFLPPLHSAIRPVIRGRNWEAQRVTRGLDLASIEHFLCYVLC